MQIGVQFHHRCVDCVDCLLEIPVELIPGTPVIVSMGSSQNGSSTIWDLSALVPKWFFFKQSPSLGNESNSVTKEGLTLPEATKGVTKDVGVDLGILIESTEVGILLDPASLD